MFQILTDKPENFCHAILDRKNDEKSQQNRLKPENADKTLQNIILREPCNKSRIFQKLTNIPYIFHVLCLYYQWQEKSFKIIFLDKPFTLIIFYRISHNPFLIVIV